MGFKVDSKIKRAIERDKKFMITTTKEDFPLVVQRASGDYIYDISGNRFIDFSTFISVYNFGDNSKKEVRDAIRKQMELLMHNAFTDYYSEGPVNFAENLLKMFPKGFGRVFFSNSGTEANEAALKFSRIFTKRKYVLAFYGGFHGRTYGSLSMTASKTVQREGSGPFGPVVHAPYAYCYRCPFKQEYPSCGMACLDYIKKYPLAKEIPPEETAAIFVEPVQGEGGYVVPPKEFIKGLREIADDNGMLLIDDEVQAGYMRTGKFLAMDNFGVKADIYTFAKSIGAGLPMGVTVTKSSLGDLKQGMHANTFGGNATVTAGADALLGYVRKNMHRIESGIKERSRIMMKRLDAMKDKYEIVGDVRGIGMMIGIEIVKDKKSKTPGTEERNRIIKEAFEHGLVLLPAGECSIRIIPQLEIDKKVLENGLDILEEAIRKVSLSA